MARTRPHLAAHKSPPNMHGLGAKLGPRIAKLVTDAQEHSYYRQQAMRSKVGADAANLFFHGINRELRDTIGQHMMEIAEHPELDPSLKPLLSFLARQPGEGSALMGLAVYGTGLSSSIGAMVGDIIAPVTQNYFAAHPNSLIPVATAIDLDVRGIMPSQWALLEALKQAINSERYEWMREGSYTMPDMGTLYELLRRGELTEDEMTFYLRRLGYRGQDMDMLKTLHRVRLSPADVADMVVRGILTQEQGAVEAAAGGITPDDFELLVEDTGEPLAMEQLLEAYRRGFIDEARLDHGIRQGRTKDEWIDVAHKLRYSPMDISDAARAVVQNYMTLDEATRLASDNGLDPAFMHYIVSIQGEPLAHGEMLSLYNRRLVSLADVKQSMRESHLKDKYIDTAIDLRRRLLPERQLVTAIEHGALSTAQATERLLELGYVEDDAKILIASGHNAAVGREKELARGDIVALYVEYAVEHADALRLLESIGYNHENAVLVMEIAEFRRTSSDINKVVTALHHLYLGRWLDDSELRADMAKMGVPAARIEHLLALWRLERDSVRPHPTAGEVAKAVHNGGLTIKEGIQRLEAMGYTTADSAIIISAA